MRIANSMSAARAARAALALAAAAAIPGAAAAQDLSFAGSPEAGAAAALTIGGLAELRARAYLGEDALRAMGDAADPADALEAEPSARIDLAFAGASSELEAKLRVDEAAVAEDPADALEELCLRAYLGDFVLEAGKMKVVWGKGDKLHVLDLFNANDYSDFIFPDYIDRRIAEPMARVAWNGPGGARVEAVWTPTMTPDRVPLEGSWAPASAAALKEKGESYVGYLAYSAYGAGGFAGLAAAQAVLDEYADASALLPDTRSLDYGQYGIRVTGSLGGVDLGASYYLGRFKTPSVYATYSEAYHMYTGFEAAYDRLQSFGLEAGTAIGPLNLRGEAAYYLTGDLEGDDPKVRNGSLDWLAGFDVDLPLSQLNLNLQTVGSYILGNEGISAADDVDYDAEGEYSNDKVVARLSDSLGHEKILPELALLWGIEREDLVLMPKCAFVLKDDMRLELSGAIFLGSGSGEFGAFAENHFAQARFSYSF
ncbi:MAG TPA: hypothetical protein PLB91_12340 [Spirochaetales bacterium]|nr:hypothetical protein [Spirochaetales bacterium]HRY55783.1 hypothetical protein [Spirochaetia bacterium]HRZ65541.1 hypothetical protein [Spirochaetia bacterium]